MSHQHIAREALIAHLISGGATQAHAEALADSHARRCLSPSPSASTSAPIIPLSNAAVTGRIVRRRGRPFDFSKRLDAHYLHAALLELGLTWRQASSAIAALLGVGEGELARAARSAVAPLEGHSTELALFAVAANAGLIAARLDDPAVNARAELQLLPTAARVWIEQAVSHRRR